MAYPAIQDADTKTGGGASSTTQTLTYPTNLAAGDLILVLVAVAGAVTTPSATGFTVLLNNSSCIVLGKVADGTETGTFTLTLSTARATQWRALRITAWFGGTLSAGTTSNASGGISATTATQTGTTTPDPPIVNPAWGSADDLLLVRASGAAAGTTTSTYPATFTNGATDNANTFLASARLNWTGGAVDPGAFTISASTNSTTGRTATIAIRPAAAAGGFAHSFAVVIA